MPTPITWLFGLAAEQPREYQRLLRIRRNVYTPLAQLDAEVLRSAEPIPFAAIDQSAFRPLRPGASWGKTFDCAWLHVTGSPDALRHPDLKERGVVLLGIRGEGLIYSAAGDILDSLSTVWQQGDLPHSGGRFRPLPHVAVVPGEIEFYADVTHNGALLYEVGRGIYRGAHVALRNDDAFGLYYDYLTLLVLAGSTEEARQERELRRALGAAFAWFSAGDIRAAREALAAPLAEPSASEFSFSAVGHGHLDMAWLWPLRETHRKAARTYTRALSTIEQHDRYVYGTSQPQQLLWMKSEQPALFERVKSAVAAKRIELQGSFWVEPDTNLPSGESLVRQALVGRHFLQEEFGVTPEQLRLCWLPDTFGYNGNLPQILKKSGMDWFQTIKLAWNKVNDFPHRTFNWQGIDGSTVLVHMPPEGDYNSRGAADGLLAGLKKYPEKALNNALLVFGSGDGGGGPGEVHLEMIGREHSLRGLPRVEYSTASMFFEKLEKLDIRHTHVGELYLETHQGTYTTQAAIKQHNRLVERKLHNAEALAVLTGENSGPALEQHWRDVLLNQFHDILPGSSIERVNREAAAAYERMEASLDDYAGRLIAQLPHPETMPSALNLTGLPRREHLSLDGRWYRADVAPYAASHLTPLDPAATPSAELAFTADSLTNGLLTLRFGSTGEIASCIDAEGNEHSAGGLNRLVLYRDPYQFPFNAWDIKQNYATTTPQTLRVSSAESSLDGATVTRRQFYRAAKFTVEQRVVLELDSDVVRFDTIVDWHEKHHMLRAQFFPAHYGDTALSEIQFGHIERVTTENGPVETAQFETCAHKWIATRDTTGGFAVLNDSKYGHRAKNGLLSLALLRSPTFPDRTADRGIHHFSYAFCPFDADDLAKVVREGYRLNNPLLISDGVAFASVAAVDDPGVIIETIKPAEGGGGVIIRLYESLGKRTTAALRVTLDHSSATYTDLMENPLGAADLTRLEFGPFEIVTVHLEPR